MGPSADIPLWEDMFLAELNAQDPFPCNPNTQCISSVPIRRVVNGFPTPKPGPKPETLKTNVCACQGSGLRECTLWLNPGVGNHFKVVVPEIG